MDKLSLNIKQEKDQSTTSYSEEIYVEILINDILIVNGNEFPVNIKELNRSILSDGDYNFWTCHCGVPACSGIVVDIKVKHIDNFILWTRIELPFLNDVEYKFELESYKNTIEECLQKLKELIIDNKNKGIIFEFYPNPHFTGIDELLGQNLNY